LEKNHVPKKVDEQMRLIRERERRERERER